MALPAVGLQDQVGLALLRREGLAIGGEEMQAVRQWLFELPVINLEVERIAVLGTLRWR